MQTMNENRKMSFGWCGALAVALLSAAPAGAQSPAVMTAQAKLPAAPVARGKTIMVAVRLNIKHPYHVNANPATEKFLIPTNVSIKAMSGVTAGKPLYPKGKAIKFAFFGKPLSVYENTVMVRLPLKVAANARPGLRQLSGVVKYQACNDKSCLMPTQTQFSAKFVVK